MPWELNKFEPHMIEKQNEIITYSNSPKMAATLIRANNIKK